MRGLINVRYRVAPSLIAGAGKGFFLEETVAAGRVLIAPGHVAATTPVAAVFSANPPPHAETSVIWYEDQCVLSPDFPDDFYINHSFSPNALWHLGFVFALRDLAAGEELLLDYRHLIADGVTLDFLDGDTGAPITGHAWRDKLRLAASQLMALPVA